MDIDAREGTHHAGADQRYIKRHHAADHIEIAAQQGIKFVERPFSVAEAKAAEEAFTSGATSFVTPVVQIDDTVLSSEPGTLTINLLNSYRQYIERLEATYGFAVFNFELF